MSTSMEASAKPRMFKNLGNLGKKLAGGMGDALGVKVATAPDINTAIVSPKVEAPPFDVNAVTPQAGLEPPPEVAPPATVVEAPHIVPAEAPPASVVTESKQAISEVATATVPETTVAEIPVEPANIVPDAVENPEAEAAPASADSEPIAAAEPVAETHEASFASEAVTPAASVLEPAAESEQSAPEASIPLNVPSAPLEPLPILSPASRPAPPSMPEKPAEASQDEVVKDEVPEDLIATEIVDKNPEQFVTADKVFDFAALKAAKVAKEIAENPVAQNLVNQMHQAGIKNPDVIAKVLQPILAKAA